MQQSIVIMSCFMIASGTAALAMAAPAVAESLSCTRVRTCAQGAKCTENALDLAFGIDRNQFAPARDLAEPPRRKVTRVQAGAHEFQAEPILMDSGVRGFWTDDAEIGAQVLTIRTDGIALYTAPDGTGWAGTCRETG